MTPGGRTLIWQELIKARVECESFVEQMRGAQGSSGYNCKIYCMNWQSSTLEYASNFRSIFQEVCRYSKAT